MRPRLLALPAALAGILLLTSCGSERAAVRSDGSPQTRGPGPTDRRGGPACDSSPAGTTAPAPGASVLPGDPTDLRQNGVEITRMGGTPENCGDASFSAGFRVTNRAAEPFSYTVTFAFLSASGEVLTHTEETVPSVEPGRTVQRTADMGEVPLRGDTAVARVRIARVRSVPADEAPSTAGPCPPSGVRVTSDDGEAAMGLRVVGLHLRNCSTRAHRLDGYPRVRLLDEDRKPVTGVEILHGSGGISTGTGFDAPPRTVILQPGESASSGLMWRNTVTHGTPVNVPYVSVIQKPGAAPVTVTPELDLGTTGKLGVSPWKKDEDAGAGLADRPAR